LTEGPVARIPSVGSILSAEIAQRMGKREQKIVDGLVSRYRLGNLTERDMWCNVAEIAALRNLHEDLQRELRKGVENGPQENIGRARPRSDVG
jgi:hypothetical protein